MSAIEPHPFAADTLGDCQDCPLPEGHPLHVDPPAPPYTPYDGSSGWSGSDTSKERADREDGDGTTSARQETALAGLGMVGARGLTWKELANSQGWHHGQASGVLSVLHKAGRIARLTERRDRCLVYVLPEHVGERETKPQGRKAADPNVVQREEWRLIVDGEVFAEPTINADHVRFMAKGGGTIQHRTVIETPWEDVE